MEPTLTYVSIITPLGEGGIGIVALGAPGAPRIVDQAFVGTKRRACELPVGAIAHGTIQRGAEVMDEVIVAHLKVPRPSMAAPYFEVNCHGGVMAVRAVLGRLEETGARPVPWTELTGCASAPPLAREAIRARALSELARAPTRLAIVMLLHQADGALTRELEGIGQLLQEGDAPRARERLGALLATAPFGRALLRPPRAALLGPPNAGKSTLFNALFEEERVIVHPEPGTTRDVVSEIVSIRGVPFEIMDAAGIGPARDEVGRDAIGRARALGESCDVALAIFDVREGPSPESLPTPNRQARVIHVANKIDLLPEPLAAGDDEPRVVCISAKERTNLDKLEVALLEPYAGLIEPCRAGSAVVFDGPAEQAIAEVLGKLESDSAGAALALLRAASSPSADSQGA